MKHILIFISILIFSSSCSHVNKKYEPKTDGFWIHYTEDKFFYRGLKNSYSIKYDDLRNWVTVWVEEKGKDELVIRDIDFSRNNGFEEFENKNTGRICYVNDYPKCSPKVIEIGKKLFKKVLVKLRFEHYLKKWKSRAMTDNGLLDSYK